MIEGAALRCPLDIPCEVTTSQISITYERSEYLMSKRNSSSPYRNDHSFGSTYMDKTYAQNSTAQGYMLNYMNHALGAESSGSGIGAFFSNLGRKWAGTGLTDSQMAQNDFNAWQAAESRNWEERMSNTAFQRQVNDMQAAGVNPALMYGGAGSSGASTPSGATATAGSNDNGLSFQEMLSALMLPMQMAQAAANISNIKANTGKTIAETEGFKLENEWRDKTMDARVESTKLANGLTAEQIEFVKSNRNLVGENIKKTIAETSNEYERKFLIHAETRLQNASAEQIAALLPYNKLLLEAQTESQKMTALASAVHAMYEQRMLDAGYIENMIETAKKQASAAMTSAAASYKMANVNAALGDFKRSIYEGKLFDPSEHGAVGSVVAKALNGTLQAVSGLATAIGGPLSGLIH